MGNLTYELPTYELRARLDKLGVEWTYANGTVRFNDGRRWFRAWAYNDDLLCVSMGYLTPEQAIAATVGNADYGIKFADWYKFPPEMMVGETVYDAEGNAIGWIVNATVDVGTCEPWDMHSNHAVQAANEQKVDERSTVPVTRYLMALDGMREASKDAERWERIARDRKSMCESLKETNADLRKNIKRIKED